MIAGTRRGEGPSTISLCLRPLLGWVIRDQATTAQAQAARRCVGQFDRYAVRWISMLQSSSDRGGDDAPCRPTCHQTAGAYDNDGSTIVWPIREVDSDARRVHGSRHPDQTRAAARRATIDTLMSRE
jgi:hypothetical protein